MRPSSRRSRPRTRSSAIPRLAPSTTSTASRACLTRAAEDPAAMICSACSSAADPGGGRPDPARVTTSTTPSRSASRTCTTARPSSWPSIARSSSASPPCVPIATDRVPSWSSVRSPLAWSSSSSVPATPVPVRATSATARRSARSWRFTSTRGCATTRRSLSAAWPTRSPTWRPATSTSSCRRRSTTPSRGRVPISSLPRPSA
mmetsp:Transcript_15602/g.45134  ORF Transcript_15602/g.45134 Transcript_15602/m.45134 type:complete len:204 (-) Transcript_15602:507-1118(-)